jgi:hypothetical protein
MIELFRDPFSTTDRYHPNPVWVSLAIFFLLGLGTFLYFSFWSR